MRFFQLPAALSFLAGALAFDCTPSAFESVLPSNASVTFTRTISDNATFSVPSGDIAYPTSPTQLRSLCAVQVNVTSSNSSAFSFGLFLPDEWNERFLAVGNGGFAGEFVDWCMETGAALTEWLKVASTGWIWVLALAMDSLSCLLILVVSPRTWPNGKQLLTPCDRQQHEWRYLMGP